MRNVQCPVCQEEPRDYYMVLDEIWRRLPKGLWRRQLCIKCLEATLGITLGPQDFKKIPLNNQYVVSRGGVLNPQFGSVKALHWNAYETSPRGLVSYTLAVGTIVVATEDFDPDGADVRKDEKGFVLLEARGGLGPLVRWFGGGMCNVYPTMCKAVWWDDTTQKIREGIT